MNLTPSKTTPDTVCHRKRISPLTLPESPVALMKIKGNLTGNARIVRDNCANICNLFTKWKVFNQEGADVLLKIINFKTDSLSKQTDETTGTFYPKGLEELVNEVEMNYSEMMKLVNEIEICKNHLHGMGKLEKLRNSADEPIFISWPTAKFGQVADNVFDVFSKELKVKLKIKERIAHENLKSVLLFLYSCWFYQIYIDSNLQEELFSMAMEVGFK